MQITEANIEIVRKSGKLFSVSIGMPIWDKIGMDDFIGINLPLLGLKTFAKDETDVEVAIREAIHLFCLNCEKFGKSLEAELKSIGWKPVTDNGERIIMVFSVPNRNSVLDQIMQTGEQFVEHLELAV